MKFIRLIFFFWITCIALPLVAQEKTTFLPKPGGKYQVGTTKLFLTDSSRKDPFKKRDFRKVYVKIWYPANLNVASDPEKYLQDYPAEMVYQAFKTKKLDRKWIEELKEYNTYSYSDAPIADHQEKFPLIIFNPGFYFGLPDLYISILEEFASQGYIVCSVNHPYEQPYVPFEDEGLYLKKKRAQWAYLQLVVADMFQWKKRDSEEHIEEVTRYYHKMLHRFNKTVSLWADDSKFVLDFLESKNIDGSENPIISKMNLDQIGALGQSLGGAVSGELCNRDVRIKAGANMDCFQFGSVIDQPIKQPFMLIQSAYNDSWNLGNTINFKNIEGDFAFLSFPGSSHFVFSDAALMPYRTEKIAFNMMGNVDGAQVLNESLKYLLGFFDCYLKETGTEFIYSDRQLSHLVFSFKKGNQFKKSSTRACKD